MTSSDIALRKPIVEIGIDSFAATMPNPSTGQAVPPADRIEALLAEVETADHAGLDVFGTGEHHRMEFLDSAPTVLLPAAAARTKNIRLASAVTVLSATDPVRTFQEFATIDLISKGRAEIVAGRGSFGEAYPLFGFAMEGYDALFAEKLDLLLKLREATNITLRGRFRPPLTGQGIFPRPHEAKLPVWLGVGGTPQSFARAGTLGLPLMVAIIGGIFDRFRPLLDLYRYAGRKAGHTPEILNVGAHATGFVGDTDAAARDAFFSGWAQMSTEIGRERGWPPASGSCNRSTPRTLPVWLCSTCWVSLPISRPTCGGNDRPRELSRQNFGAFILAGAQRSTWLESGKD